MFWHGSPKGSSAMQTVRGAGALARDVEPLAGFALAAGRAAVLWVAFLDPLAGFALVALLALAGLAALRVPLAAFLDFADFAGDMGDLARHSRFHFKSPVPCAGVPGRTFEQFTVGQRIEHRARLPVTMEDNVAFCRLTLNTQPLHLDPSAAREAGFPNVLVNGLLTFSACVGASVEDTTAGTLVANLGYQDVEHPEPVFPGDTLQFATEVLAKRPTSKPGRGIVTLLHHVHNQHGREVCHFKRIVMVRSESPMPSSPPSPQSTASPAAPSASPPNTTPKGGVR